MNWRFLLVALTLALGFSIAAAGQQGAPALIDAARQPMLTFATALAASGQPGGFILPADELHSAKGTVPRGGGRSALPDVIQALEASHPAYTARVVAGSLRVQPRRLPAALERMLTTPLLDVQMVRVGAMTAVLDLARRLSGKKEGGGVVGTGPPPDGCPIAAPITYRDGRPTAVELLDAISRQSRGLVWLATFAERPDGTIALSLGVVCPNDRLYHFEVGN